MTNRTKALIYGLQEAEMCPQRKLEVEIKTRTKLLQHGQRKWLVDSFPIFKDYLAPKFKFQKRFNAFLLFMINNSQDELLIAYSEFCRKHFPKGLPDKEFGRLPQKLTNGDIRELKIYLQDTEILTDHQFKSVLADRLNERDTKDGSLFT